MVLSVKAVWMGNGWQVQAHRPDDLEGVPPYRAGGATLEEAMTTLAGLFNDATLILVIG